MSHGQQATDSESLWLLTVPTRRALGRASLKTHITPSPSHLSAHTGAAPSFLPPGCVALSGFLKGTEKAHSLIMGLMCTVLQLGLPLGPLLLELSAPLVMGAQSSPAEVGSVGQEAEGKREVEERGGE